MKMLYVYLKNKLIREILFKLKTGLSNYIYYSNKSKEEKSIILDYGCWIKVYFC